MREGEIIISTDFRIEERWAFWQSSESRYYCMLIFLMINLPQLRQHIMIPSGIDSSLPMFSRAGSSEIIRARVYHAISYWINISRKFKYSIIATIISGKSKRMVSEMSVTMHVYTHLGFDDAKDDDLGGNVLPGLFLW